MQNKQFPKKYEQQIAILQCILRQVNSSDFDFQIKQEFVQFEANCKNSIRSLIEESCQSRFNQKQQSLLKTLWKLLDQSKVTRKPAFKKNTNLELLFNLLKIYSRSGTFLNGLKIYQQIIYILFLTRRTCFEQANFSRKKQLDIRQVTQLEPVIFVNGTAKLRPKVSQHHSQHRHLSIYQYENPSEQDRVEHAKSIIMNKYSKDQLNEVEQISEESKLNSIRSSIRPQTEEQMRPTIFEYLPQSLKRASPVITKMQYRKLRLPLIQKVKAQTNCTTYQLNKLQTTQKTCLSIDDKYPKSKSYHHIKSYNYLPRNDKVKIRTPFPLTNVSMVQLSLATHSQPKPTLKKIPRPKLNSIMERIGVF